MISRLRGRIEYLEGHTLIVDVGAFGIAVAVPTTLTAAHQVDQPIALFTHLHLREQEIALYGFVTEEELQVFELLLGVTGVGPRTALSVLSVLSPDALRLAVANDEAGVLTRVPGIGIKNARKILFHLKDKLAPADLAGLGLPPISDDDGAVIDALVTLGYSVVEAQRAIQGLPIEVTGVEERLRLALSRLAR